jgi:proteic killer suppression protein
VEIGFSNRRLAKTFSSEKSLIREFGDRIARAVGNRLSVLEHVESLAQVPAGPPERCHALGQNRQGQYAVDLVQPYRLIFEPNHDPMPMHAAGGVDISRVTAVTIIEVIDYH